ncbi:hypothetical protein GsuE55_36560 [Geobacillus subterraneus]|uniref:Aldehyde dehydrogenase domain-containing protein n=1 Tax=Geobacillus subterraneus TaxID=129338 RepID=A0A679FRP3_9BACL|nr:Delta-1-pyrroline-5-carboxylate dehydrogenase [Geobacillus sp. B4113_201601]BBW98823.1 hypothetical protein GsuE55_36560 [Geobacillus subterraneus]
MFTPYQHEPLTDFTVEKNQQAFQMALEEVSNHLGKEYSLVIGGKRITTTEKVVSINPANKEEIVGIVSKADKRLADQAMEAALKAFETWRKEKPEARAHILFRAAAILRRRRHEFSAYLVKEVGKPWKEADADTAEAIDFLEYYGRQMITLQHGVPVLSRPSERNTFHYIPLGVGLVISPFNFPLAIMAGTTVAAIVTGNTVILRPSDRAPIVAANLLK